jgi:hypothetical protein
MSQLNNQVNDLFADIEEHSSFRKGGLNFEQFRDMLGSENLRKILGGDMNGLYRRLLIGNSAEDEAEIRGLFDDALEFLEDNEGLKEQRLLGLEAIREIILERNLESLPFFEYIRFKYNSGINTKASYGRLPGSTFIKQNSTTKFITSDNSKSVVHSSGYRGSRVLKALAKDRDRRSLSP